MRGHEPDPPNPRNFRHGQKQLRKSQMPVRWIAIGIHGLAKELDLRIADAGKLANFPQDRIAGAAAFRPARVRHHAIRAGLVATLDDRQIGAEGMVAPRQFRLESLVRIRFQAAHAPLARLEPRQQERKLAVAGRAAHQADPRRPLENLFALLLRHAAEHANHLAGIAARIVLGIKLAQAREHLVRGFLPNAAGIVKNQARIVRRSHLPVSAPQENAGYFLRIVLVHLAAEGLDVKSAAR